MMKFRLEAPWYTYQKKLTKLFELDEQIDVSDVYQPEDGEADYAVDITVIDHKKFIALDRALPSEVCFGNVTMLLNLVDAENMDDDPAVELFKTIFDGNPIVKDIKELTDLAGVTHAYVRFQPEVVQFFDDDLSDYNGNWSGLAQDIAKEVFTGTSWQINFCTADLRGNASSELVKPLGERP